MGDVVAISRGQRRRGVEEGTPKEARLAAQAMAQVIGARGKGWPTHILLVPTRAAETAAAGKEDRKRRGHAHKSRRTRAKGALVGDVGAISR